MFAADHLSAQQQQREQVMWAAKTLKQPKLRLQGSAADNDRNGYKVGASESVALIPPNHNKLTSTPESDTSQGPVASALSEVAGAELASGTSGGVSGASSTDLACAAAFDNINNAGGVLRPSHHRHFHDHVHLLYSRPHPSVTCDGVPDGNANGSQQQLDAVSTHLPKIMKCADHALVAADGVLPQPLVLQVSRGDAGTEAVSVPSGGLPMHKGGLSIRSTRRTSIGEAAQDDIDDAMSMISEQAARGNGGGGGGMRRTLARGSYLARP